MSDENKIEAQDVETMLRGASLSNPAYKEALRARLFGDMQTLEIDDLALVAGGLNESFVPPEDWLKEEKRPGGNAEPFARIGTLMQEADNKIMSEEIKKSGR